jgi:D-sedoheptulose 7-phosphate isomerase
MFSGFYEASSMRDWIVNYIEAEKAALDSIPVEQVESVILKFKEAHAEGRQIFVFGNGGSASNASHFATDLGKSSSDALGKRFKVLSLNDNVSWMTAIGNDYSYEDIYLRQLENYAQAGDIVLTISLSGSSPNLVKAIDWANDNGLHTIALVGGKRGKLADLASETIVIDDTHYGRAEDCQMGIAHMLCYAFMEVDELKS